MFNCQSHADVHADVCHRGIAEVKISLPSPFLAHLRGGPRHLKVFFLKGTTALLSSKESFHSARLVFLHAKTLIRLYAKPAVIPQKISNNYSLHEVLFLVDSKCQTNYIQLAAKDSRYTRHIEFDRV